ncbi:MAG TPA: LysR family transcriptional regulator ArgP [Amycolatopsis sp.]
MMSDLPLDQVRTLLAVVDEGSFDAAAAALHVTPSAVSQRVKALEQRTGRVLVQRSKPVRLTESGAVLVRFARQLTRLEADTRAELGLAEAGAPTTLPIAVNADSLATWFLPALADLPGELRVCFDLRSDDQDHTAALLREGLVMAAVTSAPHPVQGCTATRLGRMRYRAVASPEFAERWLGDGPRALVDAPAVLFDRKDDLQDRFLRGLTRRRTSGGTRHYVPASESFAEAVAAGLGWGMVPEAQLARRGPLVDLAPDRPVDVPLYWQQWKLDSPALAAVAAAVTRAAARALAR